MSSFRQTCCVTLIVHLLLKQGNGTVQSSSRKPEWPMGTVLSPVQSEAAFMAPDVWAVHGWPRCWPAFGLG